MVLCRRNLLLYALIIWTLSGCSTLAPQKLKDFWERLDGIRVDDILETSTGKSLSFQTFIQQVSRARILYVGEVHTSPEDHRVQLEVLQGLHAVNPSLVLAMEMFPREKQEVLDRFSRGELTEKQFLEEVDWEAGWGYPFELYGEILKFARDNRLPVLGLNAPPEVVRRISREGLASLDADQRARIARELRVADSPYRDLMKSQFEQHARESIKSFETFYEAQLAWEETMAETLSQALRRHGEDTIIVALIGKGHMSHGLGVPKWTASLVPHTYKTLSPIPLNYPHSVMDARLGDYVWVTEKAEFHHRGRLGVMINPAADKRGVEILGLAPNSPAEKSGMQVGDVIVGIDGNPVETFSDLHRELQKREKSHEVILLRDGEEISVTVDME